jgi:hypothetical protein
MQEILAEFLLAYVPDLLDQTAEISWIRYAQIPPKQDQQRKFLESRSLSLCLSAIQVCNISSHLKKESMQQLRERAARSNILALVSKLG